MVEQRTTVTENGNVILIDPNTISDNININTTNSIPQYQDMHIFAELTAKSKERTVIIDGKVNSSNSDKVNFIGNNQDENNPNNLNFTTNYYDGSSKNGEQYEGFGINNIKIKINSSFIPQIDIQFVDVRGLAFFNQKDSPYRILFDFPPPIFTLTVKGYYGKPITYDLHLVKYTSEFSASNGNFIIDAQFVAVTFAPLTDILFRYVVNSALITNEESLSPEINKRPENTFQLILQLKSLYSATSKLLETETENSDVKIKEDNIRKIDLMMELLEPSNIVENESLSGGEPYLIMVKSNYVNSQNSILSDEIIPISNLSQINVRLKNQESSSIEENSSTRIYVVYIAGTNIPNDDNQEFSVYEFPTENDSLFKPKLIKFRKRLLNQNVSSLDIIDSDIGNPNSFFNTKDFRNNSETNTKYYGIDITKYYTKLYKEKTKLELQKDNLLIELTSKINAMTSEKLGMKPSIYNVFEIILNDVDKFFNLLKKTVEEATISHNELNNKKIILGDESYNESKKEGVDVYPFPLIVNTTKGRQSRVAPISLSEKVPFPELKLVSDFIDSFADQNNFTQQYLARDNKNDDGVNDWIPISPYDSTLGGASSNSPYLGIDNNVSEETLKKIIERFYVLTQGTLSESFYPSTENNKVISKANINLFSEAEAINLATTLVNEKNIGVISMMADKYTTSSIDNFYTDIENINTEYGNLYDFPTNQTKSFPIGNGDVYSDKNNGNFKGVDLTINNISYQANTSTSSLIDNWKNKFGDDSWWNNKLKLNEIEYYFRFTNENLIYILDVTDEEENQDYSYNIPTFTRYLIDSNGIYSNYDNNQNLNILPILIQTLSGFYTTTEENNKINFPGNENDTDVERQTIARNQGNSSFRQINKKNTFNKGNNIINVWASIFGELDDEIIDDITGSTQNLSRLLILSNFGNSISPFNMYENSLNSQIFDNVGAIQVPSFYSPYIGALLTAIEEGWDDEIFDYFTTGTGSKFNNRGFYILADLHDVNAYLSDYDKEQFKLEYERYVENTNLHDDIVNNIREMYNSVNILNKDNINGDTELNNKLSLYYYYLAPNAINIFDTAGFIGKKGLYFNNILGKLIRRKNIINFSQITFKMSNTYPAGYSSIKTLNENNSNFENYNEKYFKNFFANLKQLINKIQDEIDNKNKEIEKIKGDNNIINQLYYSFKNINDKWLTGSSNSNKTYPFNKPNKNLINSFAFVDRGMNPIGETIINCEILTTMLDDPNITLFSVLSQLLSLNGFEFFPLQNFLSFTKQSWVDSFSIYNGGYSDDQNTEFVCMYIGGSSSYPSVSDNGFENDGIIDITQPNISGFSTDDTQSRYEENVKQLENDNVPWSQVRAFQVKFGEQNQSMFKDIKIDSKEYPETNESIQILSRLAGDNSPDAKVPIGQNLYNLYENRSYRATVTGFGNAMIQPTQYFQLENIPLFNGAYVILDVEHTITPNTMTTSFSGTKILEYPIPRVLEANALSAYNGLTGAEAATLAANQSSFVTQERLDELNSELGVDVSHWNGNCDWNKAREEGCKFAIMKLTEGKTLDDYQYNNYDLDKNITDALDNNIIVTYYHFAKFGRTNNPEIDGQDDANNFINILNKIPEKPKLPVVLDVEPDSFSKNYKWINNKSDDINTFVKSFINTMENSGFDVMIYAQSSFIDKYNLNNYSKYPFWVARWMNPNEPQENVETAEPSLPNQWNNWTAWQFTSFGYMNGINGGNDGGRDLNMMKKDFINKYV